MKKLLAPLVFALCLATLAARAEVFFPAQTVRVTAGEASDRIAIPSGLAAQPNLAGSIVIPTSGAVVAFAFGTSTVTATPAGSTASASAHTHIGAVGPALFKIPPAATHVGFIRDGATSGTVYLTFGYVLN